MNTANVKRIQRPCHICGKLRRTEKLVEGNSICPSCYQKNYAPKRICAICNQEKTTTMKVDDKSICSSCYKLHYSPKEICSICGNLKYVCKRLGKLAICKSCNTKFYVPKQICSICGQESTIQKKIAEMNICPSCYKKNYAPKKICSICSNLDIVSKIVNGDTICPVCYKKNFRPKKVCTICNEEKYVAKNINGKPICESCYKKNFRPKKVCTICNEEKYVAKNINGKPICESCYKKSYCPRKKCSICKEVNIVQKIVDGKNVCPSCYRKFYIPKRLCFICNKESVINKIIDGKSICPSCYQKHYRTKRTCSLCGSEEFIAKIDNDLDICVTCYKKNFIPKKLCSVCGTEAIISKNENGSSICSSCYSKYYRPIDYCSICGEVKIVSKNNNGSNVCDSCYNKHYRPKRTCIICGNSKFTNKFIDEGSICPSCYKKHFKKYVCSTCGKELSWYKLIDGKRFCRNCYINEDMYHTEQIIFFLKQCKASFSNSDVYNLMLRFYEHLQIYKKPFIVYSLIANNLIIFRHIDRSNISLQNIDYKFFEDAKSELSFKLSLVLENFLIKEQILKYQSSLELFTLHRDSVNYNFTSEYENIFNEYTNYLISKKKRYINRGYDEKFSIITFKQYVRICLLFLGFLVKHEISIIELNDDYIIDFLVSSSSDYIHKQLKYFITWINNNVKLFRKLHVPKFIRSDKRRPYSDDEISIIINSINSPNISCRDKVICYLSLVYALRPFELSKIKLSDYIKNENMTQLFIRGTWIFLNPFIAEIIDIYIKTERNSNLSLGNTIDWLFFSSHYDKPLQEAQIYSILYRYNLLSTRVFTTALSQLIIEGCLSPSILIKGLGINNSTACDYYKMLGINNTFYLGTSESSESVNLSNNAYHIYILKCNDGSYYTGYTSDIQKRLKQHQKGTGCTYTKTRTPVELVYTEELPDKPSALKREKQIKKLTIFEKEKLIEKSRAN